MKPDGLLKIGQVARLFGVSTGTLRHYERIGIVKPAWVDPATDYRYYGPEQFECLNTVRFLRALDMPLDQIEAFFANRSVDAARDLFVSQRTELERRRSELARMERRIDRHLALIDEAQGSALDVIEAADTACMRLGVLKTLVAPKHYLDLEAPIRKLDQGRNGAGTFLGEVGVGISSATLEAGRFDRYEVVFLVLYEDEAFAGETVAIPSQRCARIRFRGGHAQAQERYRALLDFVRAQGCEPSGFSREITLIDEGMTPDPAEHLTEIVLPMREREAKKTME
jgi:DNA-binding transcriptional MerR regulator/effector-binding domain-containing protein